MARKLRQVSRNGRKRRNPAPATTPPRRASGPPDTASRNGAGLVASAGLGFTQGIRSAIIPCIVAPLTYKFLYDQTHQEAVAVVVSVVIAAVVFAPIAWLTMPPVRVSDSVTLERFDPIRLMGVGIKGTLVGLASGLLMGWGLVATLTSGSGAAAAIGVTLLLVQALQDWIRARPKTEFDVNLLALNVATSLGVLIVPTSLPVAIAQIFSAQWPQWINNLNTAIGIAAGAVGAASYLAAGRKVKAGRPRVPDGQIYGQQRPPRHR